MSEAVIA